jgi:DNA-binding MarR family transcriptional regulator
MAIKMSLIDRRDREILGFIMTRGETFFKELEESRMMAKSTLSKHLRTLREKRLIKKDFSKKRSLGSHEVVYVLTAKGKRLYSELDRRQPLRLEDFI